MSKQNVKEYITFEHCRMSESGKTKVWDVCGRAITVSGENDMLGTISWFGRWRRYAFSPRPHTTFEKECLRRIADFCERHTDAHHLAKRKRK